MNWVLYHDFIYKIINNKNIPSLLSTYYVPSAFMHFYHSVLIVFLLHNSVQFTDMETEPERCEITYLSKLVGGRAGAQN